MPDHVIAVDVVVLEPPAVIDVASVGVQGPPGAPGPAGPAGVPGPPGPGGTGDVTGPASATADAIAVFSGTTGKLVRDAVGAAAFGTINAIALGGNVPALSGSLRIPNGNGFGIAARNAANSANINVAYVDSGNNLQLGAAIGAIGLLGDTYANKRLIVTQDVTAGTNVAVGTNPAQSGAVRLANDQPITGRNAANTADIAFAKVNGGDGVQIGDFFGPGALLLDGNFLLFRAANANSQLYLYGGGLYPADDSALSLGTASNRWANGYFAGITPGRITVAEQVAPAAPAANAANIWLQDNGSGKSQLMIQFATGAAIAIATQA